MVEAKFSAPACRARDWPLLAGYGNSKDAQGNLAAARFDLVKQRNGYENSNCEEARPQSENNHCPILLTSCHGYFWAYNTKLASNL
jgi:hypothetical protein